MRSIVSTAVGQGAQLAVLPEGAVFGWLNPEVFSSASPIPGTYSVEFQSMARGESCWIAAGLAEMGPPSGLENG